MDDFLWWRDGVIYQIYPRSFSDGNGDGLGDLPGIISRLDYLKDLGISAIWLSPFYPTPDKDFGYDVSNYVDIDPRFGTLADFDRLVTEAHRREIRIVLDMVLNHTSDQHPWFLESRSSRENPKRDWYIWRDQPNNWQAAFGGRAWDYDQVTRQYYLHSFTKEQPDVNWRNPLVEANLLDVFRFWMDRGADGFRLDVFNAYFKDENYADNPRKLGLRTFDRQRHIHDVNQPEMIPFLNKLRHLLDSYPERYAVGETYLSDLERTVSYCGPDKLHAAFSFDFTHQDLIYPWNPAWLMERVIAREAVFSSAGIWPTTVLSNHDMRRAASRYTHTEDDAQAKLAMALLLTLRGTPFIYYGDEIGMRDISLKQREIMDPAGKKYWPIYQGRDGCRSPMQWNDSLYAGFSDAKPWLPVHPNHTWRNVAAQQADPGSLLNFTRELIRLRKEMPALRQGFFVPVKVSQRILAYLRKTDYQTILVEMNFSRQAIKSSQPDGNWEILFSTSDHVPGKLAPTEIRLSILKLNPDTP